MKWLIIKVALLFSLGGSSYAITWQEASGCFQTIVYNDVYLDNSELNYSVINVNENPLFFVSIDEEEFLVLSAVLYKGESNYHYQDIYFEDGANSDNGEYLKNDFKSYVRYRFSPDKILKLTNQFAIRHINQQTYEVVAFKNIEFNSKNFLESGRFILEKIPCYGEIETEEIFSRGIELPFELEM